MNTEDFIKIYLDDCLCYEDEFVRNIHILKKRGFYIDIYPSGKYTINEFSHPKDKEAILKYINLPTNDIINALFCRDSVYNQEIGTPSPKSKKWNHLFGSNTCYGAKIKTLDLEPFIAPLVHSLVLCGIHTYYSCDGWHLDLSKSKKAYIRFSDRFSLLWLTVLLEYDLDLSNIGLNYYIQEDYIAFPFFKESEKYDSYIKINQASNIIYKKRQYFRSAKAFLREQLLNKTKSSLSNEELINIFEQIFNIYIREHKFKDDGLCKESSQQSLEELIASLEK